MRLLPALLLLVATTAAATSWHVVVECGHFRGPLRFPPKYNAHLTAKIDGTSLYLNQCVPRLHDAWIPDWCSDVLVTAFPVPSCER